MTGKERILAEIGRLYCEEAEKYDTSQEVGAKRILDELSKFINSLPAEQPSETLKEASKNYADNEEYGDDVYFAIEAAFKAGAQFQKKRNIGKACEWLKINGGNYAFVDTDKIGNVADIDLSLIQDFKKAMENND